MICFSINTYMHENIPSAIHCTICIIQIIFHNAIYIYISFGGTIHYLNCYRDVIYEKHPVNNVTTACSSMSYIILQTDLFVISCILTSTFRRHHFQICISGMHTLQYLCPIFHPVDPMIPYAISRDKQQYNISIKRPWTSKWTQNVNINNVRSARDLVKIDTYCSISSRLVTYHESLFVQL